MKRKSLEQLIAQARDFALDVESQRGHERATARRKREYERELRAQGYSISHAKALVAERFGSRAKDSA